MKTETKNNKHLLLSRRNDPDTVFVRLYRWKHDQDELKYGKVQSEVNS